MKKLQQLFYKLLRNEGGNVMVLVALSMVMLFGFTAIVIDGGKLYLEKSRLQKALDASVLAGAQLLPVGVTDAEQTAIHTAQQNDYTINYSNLTTGSSYIQAEQTVPVSLTFARILGIDETNVYAKARAELKSPISKLANVIPVGIPYTDFSEGDSYNMHFTPGNPHDSESQVKGNFGFLDIDLTGASPNGGVNDAIVNGAEMEVGEEFSFADTETGFMKGPVKSAFETRIEQDEGKTECQDPATADNACSRIVIVPIVETYEDASGKTVVKIISFAAFWIESVGQDKNDLLVTGTFIDFVTPGEVGNGTDTGLSTVKLVE